MTPFDNFAASPKQPLPDAEVNARLAQYGVQLRTSPGKGKWPDGWWPGDDPVQIVLEESDGIDLPPHGGGIEGEGCAVGGLVPDCERRAPIPNPFPHGKRLFEVHHPATVFDAAARVRFLDALAAKGNASAAAARVGFSRETVYRARRRYPDFARLWDAALVHARARSEDELASCAFDGISTPVFVRGEHVATWRRKDPRYLLAHLARLDRRIAEDPDAVDRAERFDELLAEMAGHAAPEDFAEAAESVRDRDCPTPADVPPSREEYRCHARCEAMLELSASELSPADTNAYDEYEDEAMAEAEALAGEQWDAWKAAGMDLLDRVLAGDPAPGDLPLASVTSVNTPIDPASSCAAGMGRETASDEDPRCGGGEWGMTPPSVPCGENGEEREDCEPLDSVNSVNTPARLSNGRGLEPDRSLETSNPCHPRAGGGPELPGTEGGMPMDPRLCGDDKEVEKEESQENQAVPPKA
ncbi:hypothetical protein [Parerythrobacter lacustris]|uniref:Helix-turn-helix domain-containing protein n=1 Tax=Parerythrobacter lacustris TaxID=2969984 RepID=A0ABT1XSB5_9SPHN|nr:hypothetical protein [Parerythrobacter lacustris]MCR2834112.1 hypothetical protein [Parerythrobacter lacustris]